MPDPIELQTNNQDNENPTPEHPLASDDIPEFYEHMEKEVQTPESENSEPELSIEERQKYIEDPEARKAKIQSILQELTPDDIFNDDFEPENYQGDDANDFFEDLDDNFILRHIDDLMACGVKAETVDDFARDLFTQNQAENVFIENIDPILSHVGHGITPDTFLEICQVDPEETEGDPLIPAAKYILDTAFDYNGGEVDASTYDSMLKNGFTADEIISCDPTVERGFDESVNTLLDAGADPNKIAELYISQGECGHLLYRLDDLISHGADIDIDKVVENIVGEYDAGYDIENNIETLLKHGVDREKLVSTLKKIGSADISERTWSLLHNENELDTNEQFIDFVEDRDNDVQVKEKLSEFISKGVNLGYIINFFCYKDGSIDENGTDNIELNLDDQSVAKDFEELLRYVDINQILPHLSTDTIALNSKYLEEKGADLKPYEDTVKQYWDHTEQEMKNAGLY